MINYVIDFKSYSTSQQVPSNCNSLTFYNYGTSTVSVENVLLQPSQSLVISGNACEYTEDTFQIVFGNTGVNNLVVVKKTYLNPCS